MGAAQHSLFAEENLGPKAYVPNPVHVRNRLQNMLAEMKAASVWPWEPVILKLYRESVWPQLYAHLPDREDAARWRALIEAEAARLDAA